MRRRLSALGLLLSTVITAGCFTYPCDGDVTGCEEGEPLQADLSCTADGELSLQLREDDVDAPLSEGTWPVVHHGPQGGIHFLLGLRVEGMDADHTQLEIELGVQACEGDCTSPVPHETRTFVVDDDVLVPDGDAAELHDVVLLLDDEPPEHGRLVVTARDACGRTGTLVHSASR